MVRVVWRLWIKHCSDFSNCVIGRFSLLGRLRGLSEAFLSLFRLPLQPRPPLHTCIIFFPSRNAWFPSFHQIRSWHIHQLFWALFLRLPLQFFFPSPTCFAVNMPVLLQLLSRHLISTPGLHPHIQELATYPLPVCPPPLSVCSRTLFSLVHLTFPSFTPLSVSFLHVGLYPALQGL